MSGIERIAAERRRQIEVEGWMPEHDEQHDAAELIEAAACYIEEAGRVGFAVNLRRPHYWPWSHEWWKPEPRDGGSITFADAMRMLEKAGALIAAEIDRLERLEAMAPREPRKGE